MFAQTGGVSPTFHSLQFEIKKGVSFLFFKTVLKLHLSKTFFEEIAIFHHTNNQIAIFAIVYTLHLKCLKLSEKFAQ